MSIESQLRSEIAQSTRTLYGQEPETLQLQPTNPEFEGSHTLVCFPLTRISKKKPEETAQAIGSHLVTRSSLVGGFNVVKGFLNLTLKDTVWVEALREVSENPSFGFVSPAGREIMVEYSSPNTNKPLHLGHLRNNFLGWSVAEIYKALGYTVHKVQIINDRGIHICKSMAAWMETGNGETPASAGLKGDHLVGKYYVAFDRIYRSQIENLHARGMHREEAEKEAPIMKKAVDLLRKWEQKDAGTLALWKRMNSWVYEGFEATYKAMGVDFEKLYYESETYLLGREEVLKGLAAGVFEQKPDGSVWVDLTDSGLDQKVLLRADGTSVYITQDIGTAILRFRDFPKISRQVYTVGSEQDYHFKVLFLILEKLGYAWARECFHLSYGMVDLPTGRMKSREGTVVDADDLIAEMIAEAKKQTQELGKVSEYNEEQAAELHHTLGLGALKFFLLKVDPRKRMLFDPKESIQLQGHTGPFIQYTYARIRALQRKATGQGVSGVRDFGQVSLLPVERSILALLTRFPDRLEEAAREYSPAVVANYAYELAKEYNRFYQEIPVLAEPDAGRRSLRLTLSAAVAETIRKALGLLGMNVPERM
jgi:arginyl-tRNA synthetase